MTKNNNNKLAIINQTNTNNNDNKGGRKMKNKRMKTRIIAGMLSMIAVFSEGTASVTTATAAHAVPERSRRRCLRMSRMTKNSRAICRR